MECTNESAVSPVIGVMLMLVVTIIIAAVVSAFAGGMTDTETNAPRQSFREHTACLRIFSSFIMLEGSTVNTKNHYNDPAERRGLRGVYEPFHPNGDGCGINNCK